MGSLHCRMTKYYRSCQASHGIFIRHTTKFNKIYFQSLPKRSSLYFSTEIASTDSTDSTLPFIITEASCNRLNFLKKKRDEKDLMLRIGVSSGGCSGFQYEFELAQPSDFEEDEDI